MEAGWRCVSCVAHGSHASHVGAGGVRGWHGHGPRLVRTRVGGAPSCGRRQRTEGGKGRGWGNRNRGQKGGVIVVVDSAVSDLELFRIRR